MCEFKVGDIVVCVDDTCDMGGWAEKYLKKGQEYVVTKVHGDGSVSVGGLSFGWFASRFELKQQPAEQPIQKPVQQKTKLVPFTHELWEKWKDKGVKVVYANGPHTVEDLVCFSNAVTTFRYAGYVKERDCVYVCEMDDLSLEIPITTKRVPFNPERKDAKVFYGEQELIEWVQMKSGVVCGTIKLDNFNDEHTSLYHPNDLEMEIEE